MVQEEIHTEVLLHTEVNTTMRHLFSCQAPNLLSQGRYPRVHPVVKNLFSSRIPDIPLAGRLKHFLKNWQILTQDPEILNIVQGYRIPFLTEPKQKQAPKPCVIPGDQIPLVNQEIQSMLEKGAVQIVHPVEKQFLSNIFLVGKKEGGNRPVINLKELNNHFPYQHFKMEGLHLLKEMLQPGDFMCKLDLKDAYFSVPLHARSRKAVRFLWQGTLYEFLCLFWSWAGPSNIYKTTESTNCTITSYKQSDDNLSGRHQGVSQKFKPHYVFIKLGIIQPSTTLFLLNPHFIPFKHTLATPPSCISQATPP